MDRRVGKVYGRERQRKRGSTKMPLIMIVIVLVSNLQILSKGLSPSTCLLLPISEILDLLNPLGSLSLSWTVRSVRKY